VQQCLFVSKCVCECDCLCAPCVCAPNESKKRSERGENFLLSSCSARFCQRIISNFSNAIMSSTSKDETKPLYQQSSLQPPIGNLARYFHSHSTPSIVRNGPGRTFINKWVQFVNDASFGKLARYFFLYICTISLIFLLFGFSAGKLESPRMMFC
jgi:hypothetical protein